MADDAADAAAKTAADAAAATAAAEAAKTAEAAKVADAAKTAEAAKAAEAAKTTLAAGGATAPVTVADLKIPQGSKLDAKSVESLVSFSKEKGLSKEQTQAILDRDHASISEREAAQATQLKSLGEQWLTASKADKELIGEKGDAFNENVTLAQRVVSRYGDDDFKKALNETGLGNHPALLKFVARIGKVIGNDKLVVSTTSGSQEKTASEIFYPKNPA